MPLLNKMWDEVLNDTLNSPFFLNLETEVNKKYETEVVYPIKKDLYKAFKLTDYNKVKVVIIGQDPYHGKGEANGLCFSVNNNVKIPPSLRNIYKELESDLKIKRLSTDLSDWASQGVFLLNAFLTVKENEPLSHKKIGWEIFTDEVIKVLNQRDEPIIFILWGSFARSKKKIITNKKHFIIESAHPSPLSSYRGFFGSKPFSKVNTYLSQNNSDIIKW